MSNTHKHVARHASKQSSSLARATTTVAVTGGLVAGIAVAESAGASSAHSAPRAASTAAATQPLQLKAITPAKSLRIVMPAAATKPAHAATSAKAPKAVSRSLARAALSRRSSGIVAPTAGVGHANSATPLATAAPQRAARHATRHHARTSHARVHHVSRTQVRQAVTQRTTVRAAAARQASVVTPRAAAPAHSTSGIVNIAAGLSGIPYVWGGGTTAGFDCSGFVSYVYAQVGIQLPHQSGEIRAMATPVSDPRPGDLVFLPGHVAIYAGNGMVYEAHRPGSPSGLYPLLPGSTFGRVA